MLLGQGEPGEQINTLANVVFTGQDKDGDQATITVSLDVKDDVPTCMHAEIAVTEDEQFNPPTDEWWDNVPDYTNVATGNVANNGNWGADGFDKVTTISIEGGDGSITVNPFFGATLYWNQAGELISGPLGAAASLHVNANGTYSFVLFDNMLLGQGEPGEQINTLANVVFTGQDKDGDQATITVSLDVKDDVPGCMAAERAAIVEDEQFSPATDESDNFPFPDYTNVVTGDVSNNGNWGADGFDKITTIKVGDNAAVTVGSGGVTVYWSADGTYLGTSSSNAAASLQVEADGDYTYRLLDNMLLSGTGEQTNVLATVVFTGQDKDGDQATISLTLDVMDDVPVARNDFVTQAVENQSVTFSVFGNDSFGADDVDTDNTPVVAVTFTQPSQGTVSYDALTGLFTYTPVPGAGSNSTQDSFTYTIKDGDGDTSMATVSVTLKPDSTPTVRVTDGVVDEQGLPTGTGEFADGDATNNSDTSETTTGTFTIATGGDTLSKLEVQAANGTWVDVTGGGIVSGANGTLTVSVLGGNYTWSYTLTNNLTTHDDTSTTDNDGISGTDDQKPGEAFAVRVTDSDNDVSPTTTLDITVNDDAPVVDVSSAVTYTLHVTNYGETEAGYDNSFGYYIKDASGNPTSGVVVWDNVKGFVNGSIDITGHTPDEVGFFIIPNGNNLNYNLAAGTEVTFVLTANGWQAVTVSGSTALLGQDANVLFDVSSLNTDGLVHVQDLPNKPGNLNWEDISGGGDRDYDDVNIGVTWTSNLPVLTTQDADTIGTDTDTASTSFASMFSIASNPGADGLGSSSTSYTLSITDPDSGLTSAGKPITLAMDGDDIVGSTTDGEVFRISVDDAGLVTLSQSTQVDHLPEDVDAVNDNYLIALPDGKIALTATASITDGDGDVASDSQLLDISASFQFEDDIPTAANDQLVVVESGQVGKTYNLMLIVDISDSMNQTEVGQEVSSLKALLDQYALVADGGAAGVHVQLVSFASNATLLTPTLVSIADAKLVLDGLVARSIANTDGTMTDYDAAVATASGAINNWSSATSTHANVVYFVSDGAPTEGNSPSSIGLTDAEEAAWESTLSAKGVTAWAIGVGTNSSVDDDLADVALPDGNVVLASNFSTSLLEQLVGTVPQPTTYRGSVLDGDTSGADAWGSPVLVSVTYGLDTYAFADATDTHTFSLGSVGSITIKADGSYVFTPASDVKDDVSADIKYVVQDGDGDTAGATLTLTVKDSSEVAAFDNYAVAVVHTEGTPPVEIPVDWDGSNHAQQHVLNQTPLDKWGRTSASDTVDNADGSVTVTDNNSSSTNWAAIVTKGIVVSAANATISFDLDINNTNGSGSSTDRTSWQLYKLDGSSWVAVSGAAYNETYTSNFDDTVSITNLATGTYRILYIVNDRSFSSDSGGNYNMILDNVTVSYPGSYHTVAYEVSGNVIDDANTYAASADPWAATDSVGSEGAVVTSVVFNSTSHAVASTGTTTIDSDYGTLVIAANGEYTYTPDATSANLTPHSEVFTYVLTQPDGDTDSANLVVQIENNAVVDSVAGGHTLTGTAGDDVMLASTGDDLVYGLAGNDHLDGGAGNDVLVGGLGNDVLVGGAGADTFVFRLADATTSPTDTVTDFGSGDTLRFEDVVSLDVTYDSTNNASTIIAHFNDNSTLQTVLVNGDVSSLTQDHNVVESVIKITG